MEFRIYEVVKDNNTIYFMKTEAILAILDVLS
jgi:hypothetical protein